MNKKGFTIIEIIICLGIITLIGTISTVVLVKNNKDKNIEKITNNIFDAAKVFANIEKDEDGNNYINEIEKGRGGVKIPLSILVNKGYVKKEDANVIYNEYKDTKKLENNEDYYILLLDGSESKTDSYFCENNQYQLEASWKIDKNKTLYLCNNKVSSGSSSSLSDLLILNNKVFFNPPNRDDYKDDDRGLYILRDYSGEIGYRYGYSYKKEDGNSLYFYGNVDNNYLNFAGETWRIVRINGDGSIKIILNENIPVTLPKAKIDENGNLIKDESGEMIKIEDKKLVCIPTTNDSFGGLRFCFYDFSISDDNSINNSSIPVITYSSECKSYETCKDVWPWHEYGSTGDNSFYSTTGTYRTPTLLILAKFWYNQKIVKYIVEERHEVIEKYISSGNFYNVQGDTEEEKDLTTFISKNGVDDIIGLISLKEYTASVGYSNNAEKTPNSYLIDNNISFFLSNFYGNSQAYYYNNFERKIDKQTLTSFTVKNPIRKLYFGNILLKTTNNDDAVFWNSSISINNRGIRPVINLKKGLCFKGDGSKDNPYKIIDGECN